MKPTKENLAAVKVLYRQGDTLALWGVPYEMRPGQQPGDIFRGPFGERERDRWVWLGCPGWFGSMSPDEQANVKSFIAANRKAVPEWPEEWSRLAEESSP